MNRIMTDLKNLCFSCMNDTGGSEICPHCGNSGIPESISYLALIPGTMLAERYYIGKCTRANSEGFTYIAFDTQTDDRCTVREFFPAELAERKSDGITVAVKTDADALFADCRASFGELWNKLMRLRGLTALVSVYDLFSANLTSYAVYHDIESLTLRDYLLDNGQGYISWDQARILFMPVLSTLGTLHTSGVIHRNLNPSSFFFSEDGKLKITDYVIPQAASSYGELDSVLTDGYAPIELYREDDPVGSWTDIYSFAAVIYRTLIGTTPIPAPVRAQNDQMMIPAKFAEILPPHIINAIINGMQIDPTDRTRNAEQLRSNLSASPRAVSASAHVFPHSDNAPVQPARPGAANVRTPIVTQPREPEKPKNESKSGGQLNYEQFQKQEKNRKTLKAILVAVIVTLFIGVALIVSALFGMNGGSHGGSDATTQSENTVVVQSFLGRQYNDVVKENEVTGNFIIKKVEQSNDAVPSGQIIGQDIPANSSVAKGTTITFTVSGGPQVFPVPEVSGQTYEQALATLSAKGLKCEPAKKYNDGTHPANTVAETVPPAGQGVKSGDKVTIVVYSDPQATETDAILTPDVPSSLNGENTTVSDILSIFR